MPVLARANDPYAAKDDAPAAKEMNRGNDNFMVALLKAISHPSIPVRRLLELAQSWPESLPDEFQAPVECRTAKQLRADELDQLVQDYRSGETVFELAKRFGIHRATVGSHLRARGINTTPPAIRPEDAATVADLYQAGWSFRRIGEKFNVSDAAVRARLLEAGVRIRGAHERLC